MNLLKMGKFNVAVEVQKRSESFAEVVNKH